MLLEQLRQLSVVEQCGTLARAAEVLHLSQPALSRSIRRLEAELGHELFDRSHNAMRLNDAGRVVLGHARAMLAEERRLRDDIGALNKRTRTIRVASVAPAATWRLSSLILEQQPTAILEPDIVSEDEVAARLLNGDCDLAVAIQPPRLPHLRSMVLMEEDLYANVPLTHRLAERAALAFADLDGESFLVYGGIGFWKDVHRRMLPHAHFVTQPDRTIFLQQVTTSDLLTFTTNAPENTSGHPTRRPIPITDPEAHATFRLCMREDAEPRIAAIFAALGG